MDFLQTMYQETVDDSPGCGRIVWWRWWCSLRRLKSPVGAVRRVDVGDAGGLGIRGRVRAVEPAPQGRQLRVRQWEFTFRGHAAGGDFAVEDAASSAARYDRGTLCATVQNERKGAQVELASAFLQAMTTHAVSAEQWAYVAFELDRRRVGWEFPCQRSRVDDPEPEQAGTREGNAGEVVRSVHAVIVAGCQLLGRGHVARQTIELVGWVRPVQPSCGFL